MDYGGREKPRRANVFGVLCTEDLLCRLSSAIAGVLRR